MPRLTRRDLLKTALVTSAGAATGAAFPLGPGGKSIAAEAVPGSLLEEVLSGSFEQRAASPRERLLLDFGFRFQFGHVYDPAKDFGFGERRRVPIFAKSGSFPPVTGVKFDDSGWKSIDLPHDWAVDLPFQSAPTFLTHHGAKPLGREYPETSIGWYRRVFDLPASDSGKRIRIAFDGAFRNAMVIFNGHYLGENFSGYAPFSFDVTDFANFGDKNVL